MPRSTLLIVLVAVVVLGAIALVASGDDPVAEVATDRGTRVEAPGTTVDSDKQKTRIQAPGVDITVPNVPDKE